MARIQQSIEVGAPVHEIYHQLTQFEQYPRFMQDVRSVRQVDETHLLWSTTIQQTTMEWDVEITEQHPDRIIAWRNTSGPASAGKVELQSTAPECARVTLTMECEPAELFAVPQDADPETAMSQRVQGDLVRLKKWVETRNESDNSSSSINSGDVQAGRTMQSSSALSQSSSDQAEDGRFSVAEEQNTDQQSNEARRVGQMPQDTDAAIDSNTKPSEAMAESIKEADGGASKNLSESLERAIPPSV